MAGAARHTKRVAKNRAFPPTSWKENRFQAWKAARVLLAHGMTLFRPRAEWQVVMFPGAFECHRGRFVTQVPDAEIDQHVPVERHFARTTRFSQWWLQGFAARMGHD